MESKFDLLGSCRGFIYTHFEVKFEMISHTVQKLYPIYPRYQGGGGYHLPRFSTISYPSFNIKRHKLYHSIEGMWGYISMVTELT